MADLLRIQKEHPGAAASRPLHRLCTPAVLAVACNLMPVSHERFDTGCSGIRAIKFKKHADDRVKCCL